ncbi:hypothetical protein AAFF_G00264510, partial [Aldrovandia affinis]
MQASSALKSPRPYESGNGTGLECERSYGFHEKMAYRGSCCSPYKPQISLKKEKMDAQLLPSAVFSDPSLDPALLYSAWSMFTDDVNPAATFLDHNLSRPQVNLPYSGNGPDVFGMVSSILEEPNPEHLADWNSSSKLFPLWATESDRIDQQENMAKFGNGSDVINISDFYQDTFQKIEGDHMETLYHDFQGLSLLDSWLVGGKKDSDLPTLDYTHFTGRSYNQDAVLKGNSSHGDDFSFSKRECDPCVQDANQQEVLNGRFEKTPGEFSRYAFHNRSNSNNTCLQKEFKEQGRDTFFKCGGSMEQTRFPRDQSSPPHRDKWPQAAQQRQYPLRGYEDYNIHPPRQKAFSPSQSHYGQQHTKVSGRGWKTAERLGPNLQNSRKAYDQCQINSVDLPCDFVVPAANPEPRNGNYLAGKSAPVWPEGDSLCPSWKSIAQNGRKSSPAHSPQVSVSGLSNLSTNGNHGNHMLASSTQSLYSSRASPVSPGGRQDRRTKPGESRPAVWSRGSIPGNANLSASAGRSRSNPTVTKDSQRAYLGGWAGSTSTGEDPDRYLCNQTKHSLDGREDNKATRKNSNWFPNAYGGPNRHQNSSSSSNNHWCKQDPDPDWNYASDFNSAHFSPPIQLVMGALKQSASWSQFGLRGGAGGRGSGGSFPLPQSGLPFPELLELLQGKDLSHLGPLVSELLNGDVPPPYFGLPSLFNKYRPVKNRS